MYSVLDKFRHAGEGGKREQASKFGVGSPFPSHLSSAAIRSPIPAGWIVSEQYATDRRKGATKEDLKGAQPSC